MPILLNKYTIISETIAAGEIDEIMSWKPEIFLKTDVLENVEVNPWSSKGL